MGKVTQADIARDLGVSQMTVSKAIRGAARISDDLRQRILDRATELGYSPNRLARSLQDGCTHIIGYLAPSFSGQFCSGVDSGIRSALSGAGYSVLLSEHLNDVPVDDQAIQSFLEYGVDGIIAWPHSAVPWEESVYARLRPETPVIYIDNQVPLSGAHNVFTDDWSGMRQVVDYLVRRGHRNIGYLYPCTRTCGVDIRRPGFETAMASADLAPVACQMPGDMSRSHDKWLRQFLFEKHPELTALVCWNDSVAMHVVRLLRGFGLQLPDDMSIVGYGDEIFYADELRLPLTTVCQHPEQLGREAARSLIRLIEGRQVPAAQPLPASLIVRQSVTEPRQAPLTPTGR